MIFKNCRIYIDGKIKDDMWLKTEGTKIAEIGSSDILKDVEAEFIDLGGRLISPGFIDQHVHGAGGCDFMDGTMDSVKTILETLVKEGVTGLLATTTTDTEDIIIKALKSVRDVHMEGLPEILGVHLEGPYLSKKAPGAHLSDLIIRPSVESFEKFQKSAGERIKLVTLAVEEDKGYSLVKHLSSKGVVASIGHSVATYEQAEEAINMGCSCITHCYNAMSGLHHRDAGVVGAGLLINGVKSEIIADMIHVSAPAIKVFDKMKSDEDKILITDSMRAKGLPKGEYELCSQKVYSDGIQVRTPDGALAGSLLTCNRALKNYISATGKDLEKVLPMLTENPAKLLDIFDRKGSIEVGKDADLVILDGDLSVYMTVCNGKVAYKNNYENNRG